MDPIRVAKEPAERRDLAPGQMLGGRYEIRQKLGQGGFSSVYRAWDRTLDTDCALKILHLWAMTERRAIERFKREVLLSRRIVHEGCCRIYDFAEFDDMAVLTMEFVEGWSVAEVLQRGGTLPMPVATSLAAQACAAVAALHRNNILHRDIKAENLMVNREGRLKVLDLGLSWSSELSSLTASGTLLGTPTHMAPECILGEQPTTKTDVYALGILTYHLLTGRLPFRGSDIGQVLSQQVQSEPQPPRQVRPSISEAVEELALVCLAKDPKARPADARSLEEAWLRMLGGPPNTEVVRELLERLMAPGAVPVPGLPTPDPSVPTFEHTGSFETPPPAGSTPRTVRVERPYVVQDPTESLDIGAVALAAMAFGDTSGTRTPREILAQREADEASARAAAESAPAAGSASTVGEMPGSGRTALALAALAILAGLVATAALLL